MVSAENDQRRVGTIWVLDLDSPTLAVEPLVSADFRRIGKESLSALATAMGIDSSTEILKRFESGRRCYSALVDDRIAAYGWVSFEEEFIGELNLRLGLLPGEAYIWDCATLRAFRQKHLYSALLAYIVQDLRAEQVRRIWIGADRDNIASQRGIARAGFVHIADLVVERVLALRQAWVQGRPDVPEALVEEARRAFLNNRDKVWLHAPTSSGARQNLRETSDEHHPE